MSENSLSTREPYSIMTLFDYVLHNINKSQVFANTQVINVSTEQMKWHPMLWQMRESMLSQILNLLVANDTQKIQFSDQPKWHCALWPNIFSRLKSNQTSFQNGPTNGLSIRQLSVSTWVQYFLTVPSLLHAWKQTNASDMNTWHVHTSPYHGFCKHFKQHSISTCS